MDQMQDQCVHHDENKRDELNLDSMLMKVDRYDHSFIGEKQKKGKSREYRKFHLLYE